MVKISVLLNLIYRFNAVSIKISANNFIDLNKLILMFIKRGKTSRLVNTILKNKGGGLMLPNFEIIIKLQDGF